MPRTIFQPEFRRKLEILDLVSRKHMRGRGRGERRGPKRGSGVEFHDFRPYAAGDDLRYLDWNIFSRLDRLVLKLFIEEEDLCLHLLLDASRSMAFGEPSKLTYAAGHPERAESLRQELQGRARWLALPQRPT